MKCRYDLFYWQSYSISRHLKLFLFSKIEHCVLPLFTWGASHSRKHEISDKKKLIANCGPYFIALQVINNYETQRLYKTTVYL